MSADKLYGTVNCTRPRRLSKDQPRFDVERSALTNISGFSGCLLALQCNTRQPASVAILPSCLNIVGSLRGSDEATGILVRRCPRQILDGLATLKGLLAIAVQMKHLYRSPYKRDPPKALRMTARSEA